MNNKLKPLLLISLFLTLISCGDSPLLNHEDESTTPQSNIDGLTTSQNSFRLDGVSYKTNINWTKGPYSSPALESKILISLLDTNGNLINLPPAYHLELWGYMPSMGHGTAYDGYIEHLGQGTYMNFELFFNMPGDWEINIEIKKGSKTANTVKYRFEIL